MPTADYSSYHQPSGTGADGTKYDNFIDAVQATVNGLDKNNLAAAAGILPSQLADPTSGKVLGSSGSACAAVFPPGFEFGYDAITSPVSVTSTVEATGTTVISAASHTFDGAPVFVEFFAPYVNPAAANGGAVTISLFEGATQLSRLGLVSNVAASANFFTPFLARIRLIPTAGAHTYTITAHEAGGTGSIGAGATGTGGHSPAFVRFVKA